MYLSVVIPCYNEEKNLRRGALEEVDDYLSGQSYESEVIVVDDGSTDGSLALVEKFARDRPRFQVLKENHQGKHQAVRKGLERASGEIVLFQDLDQSSPLSEVEKLLPFFQNGYDVVIGSRGTGRKDFPWYRRFLSWGFRSGRQLLILRNIVDTQCGFKAFRRETAHKLFSQLQIFADQPEETAGWRVTAFDVELLFVAEKLGYEIAEVPVHWQDQDASENKDRSFIKESREMAIQIARVIYNDCRGRYDQA